jgi:predicted Zn-dependent protease with MMP-like domain
MVSDRQRDIFDRILDRIVDELPQQLHELIEELPVIVEDEPSLDLLDEMDVGEDSDLCGLHWGTPLTRRSVSQLPEVPDRILMFRGPIIRLAGWRGRGTRELERQIRITLLHEIGHHFGLDEDDLARLGYG